MPYRTAHDYDNYLARLDAFPRFIQQTIALLREGMRTGWVQPAFQLRGVPAQIEAQLVADPTASPLYAPVKTMPAGISAADRARIEAAARRAIIDSVVPALRALRDFVQQEYLPAGRKNAAGNSLPGGSAYYAWQVRRYTTLSMPAETIHQLGLDEVKRIRLAMDSVQRQVGFTGSFAEFLQFLRTDPRFYYATADELTEGYREHREADRRRAAGPVRGAAADAIRREGVPRLRGAITDDGALLPVGGGRLAGRLHDGEHLAAHGAPEVRNGGAHAARGDAGSSPADRTGPGARGTAGVPPQRRLHRVSWRDGRSTPSSWASDLGLYTDPYSRFGQLTYEMWRACRLVIDTGIHTMGWSRDSAIAYLLANSAKTEQDAGVEVDRYIVWPGQALAYKMGELRIVAIRKQAEAALGPRFDVRRFHNALLDNGPVPLEVLQTQMDAWIKAQ